MSTISNGAGDSVQIEHGFHANCFGQVIGTVNGRNRLGRMFNMPLLCLAASLDHCVIELR